MLSITPTGSDTALSTSTPTSAAELAKANAEPTSTEHLATSLSSLPPLVSSSSPSSPHIQFVEADALKSKSLDKGVTHHLMPPALDSAGSCSLSRSSSTGQASSNGGSQTTSNPYTPLFERQIVISLGSININLVKGDGKLINMYFFYYHSNYNYN